LFDLMSPQLPRVIYVSYDGAAEPLGASQVVPYLVGMARDARITLISFEKTPAPVATRLRLQDAGVRWTPLRYHRSPPVASTAIDIRTGAGAIRKELPAAQGPAILHARSYVAALMAVRSGALERARFIFDIRGFWADERVEGGIWRRGLLYRIAKRFEREFFRQADAVVTLTAASVPQIREWLGPRDVPVEVIPTCVDTRRFYVRPPNPDGPRAVWSGSVGTWYRLDLGVKVASALGMPLYVMTQQVEEAKAMVGQRAGAVSAVRPDDVPVELAAGDVGLCLVRPSFSKLASAPTRVGEHLAAGNPVVALAGVGDLDRFLEQEGVGVVLPDDSDESIQRGSEQVQELLRDPDTPQRCRSVALQRFSLDRGIARYLRLYRDLHSANSGRREPRGHD
jgi:glycosyltransferase involved in cell wall biosynthesis